MNSIRMALAKLRQAVKPAALQEASLDTAVEFTPRMVPALLARNNPIILDIGCNDGQHTLEFLKAFRRPTVYCFEPDARAQHAFKSNVQSTRAHLFEMALGDKDGVADFHASGGAAPAELGYNKSDWDLSGSLRRPKNHLNIVPWVSFNTVMPVKVARLDTWAAEHRIGVIDFIWADVQGAEVDLIRGGMMTLRNTRYLYTEYSDYELYEGQVGLREIMDLLPDFEVLRVFASDVLLRNTRRLG